MNKSPFSVMRQPGLLHTSEFSENSREPCIKGAHVVRHLFSEGVARDSRTWLFFSGLVLFFSAIGPATILVAKAQEVNQGAGMSVPARLNADSPVKLERKGSLVSVTPVVRQPVAITLPASGSLVARREVPVGTELSGFPIISVEADVNDRVAAGQLLVRLDTKMLEIELRQNQANADRAAAAIVQAEAGIPEAQSALNTAEVELVRAQKLQQSNVVSEQSLGQRKAAVDQARARVDSARAAVAVAKAELGVVEAQADQIRERIAKGEIRAPVAGVVLTRVAEPGAILSQNSTEPLMRILAEGEVEFAADLPDVDLGAIEPGQNVNVFLADGAELSGTVRMILPLVQGSTRLGTVRIALPHDVRLRPGAYARADIVLSRENKLTVPIAALTVIDGRPTVLVVNNQGLAERRVVELGEALVKERLVLEKGVSVGEQVVLSAAFVREGEPVRTLAGTEQE